MKRIRIFAAAAAALCLAANAWAGDGHDHSDHAGHDHAKGAGYDEAAMMEAWMKAATPGEPHQMLAKMAGNWKTKLTHYEMGEVSEVTEGTVKYETAMGGRIVIGHYTGSMMGQPHKGMSIDGYDNMTGKYWSTWIDNMGTGLMVSHGAKKADGSLEHTGTMTTPMGECGMRFVTTNSDGKMNMKMYMTMPGMDQESLAMDIDYTRVSS